MIELLENHLGRKAKKIFLPMQAGDVKATFADIEASCKDFGYSPKTDLDTGLSRFAEWFLRYQAS